MNYLNKIELMMIEWQTGVRILYEDLQKSHKWSNDKVWNEVSRELKRISQEGDFGEDDLICLKEVITAKRDIKLWEAVRLAIRFQNKTPLLDAIKNLQR